MAGTLTDDDTSGAVPPIGTSSHPFTGVFDGNGKTISNLWVSTNPDDWKQKPELYSTYGLDFTGGVGMFGYVNRPSTYTDTQEVYVGNFFLENIEVKSTITGPAGGLILGLICEYANAGFSKIGVDNGIITIPNSTAVVSNHTLIGKIEDESTWGDVPGHAQAAGGDLVIAPSGLRATANGTTLYHEFTDAGTSGLYATEPADANENASWSNSTLSGKAHVPGSQKVDGYYNAYFVGSLGEVDPKPQPVDIFYKYTASNNVVFTTGSKATHTINGTSDTVKLNASTPASVADPAYINYITNSSYRENSEFLSIEPKAAIGWTINNSSQYPTNCVWFKPRFGGKCYIAFSIQKMNSDRKMSIYRFKRNSSGAIITSSKDEIEVVFKKNSLTNGSMVLFEINILDTEVEAGYEYAIGQSSSGGSQSAVFSFLKLAGSDTHGTHEVDGTSVGLEKIEFVNLDTFTMSDFDVDNYHPDNTDLKFSGTANNTILKFVENASHIVYYKSSGGVTISDNVSSPASQQNTSDSVYPPRVTSA